MKKDIVLIFDGGSTRGVFGAGVLTQFIKNGLYKRVHSVYGISAGAHNGAFFITKQYKIGASIYYDDLTKDFFNSRFDTISRFILKMFKKNTRLYTSIALNHLMTIEKTTKKLDTKKILDSDIRFFVRVFNIKKKKEEYLSAKKGTLKKIKASSALFPLYPNSVNIENNKYFDGGLLSSAIDPHLKSLIKRNKDKKFILVYNFPIKGLGAIKKEAEDLSLGLLLLNYFKKDFVMKRIASKIKNNQFEHFKKPNNFYIIHSDIFMSPFCKNKDEFLKLYNHGIEKARNFNFKT